LSAKEVEVTSLHVYPVKSAKGIGLSQAELTPQGLKFDRSWMVVMADGRFATQRQIARMALIETALVESGLRLSIAGQPPITISYEVPQGDKIITKVWEDEVVTVDEGEVPSKWLTEALETEEPVRLVRMAPDYQRPQGQPEVLGKETSVYFADAAPFLIVDEASLAALNKRLETQGEHPVPMNRFRPNIVIRGLAAFEEHKVSTIANVDCQFRFRFACERCVITTTDQTTAARNSPGELLKTLKALNPSPNNKPAFGQNCTLDKSRGGRIAVGDRLMAMP
jgi:uncharacterized protein YcbX